MVLLLAAASLWGCHRQGVWVNVETMPHEWVYPPEGNEFKVSEMPVPYEELGDYVRYMEEDGWRVHSYESAGEFLPQKYIIVFYRPKGKPSKLP